MTSFPDYDPSLWVGGMKQADFDRLNSPDANQPFLNRAIAGLYPPGSTFKPFVAATALNEGLINGTQVFNDPGYFKVGRPDRCTAGTRTGTATSTCSRR